MQVYINFGGLPSWLAIAPLKRIIAETGVAIDWQPMLGNLGNVASANVKAGEEDPLADYKARRAAARSRAKARELERMCETLELSPQLGSRKIDPLFLALGLLWAREKTDGAGQMTFVETAFTQTYRTSAEPSAESVAGVTEVLKLAGVDADGFAAFCEAERESLKASRETTLQKSVLNAPAFILEEEVFNGREHLPLIEWILKGRTGTPPV
ncbi:MAG: hypothetical protein ISP91_09410 [Pseudomonadales bacterium]|jgi:2-hydroxychromene-2-carboxylate isomerase|nr:hypothetical protein [Pseudomonadales bacterium]